MNEFVERSPGGKLFRSCEHPPFIILRCITTLRLIMYIIKVSIRSTAVNIMAYTIFKAHFLRERGLLVVVLWGCITSLSVTALMNLEWNNFYK